MATKATPFIVRIGICLVLVCRAILAADAPPFRWVTAVASDYQLDDMFVHPSGYGVAVFTNPESESKQLVLGDHRSTGTWFLARFDNNGRWEWVQSLGSEFFQYSQVTIDSHGDCIAVSGRYKGTDSGYAISLAKRSSDGNRIWSEEYTFPNYIAGVEDIATDEVGNIYLAGTSRPQLGQGAQGFILSFSPIGSFRWFQQIGNPQTHDRSWRGIAARQDGELVVCGQAGSRSGNRNIAVARYGQDGQFRGEWTAPGPGNEEAVRVVFSSLDSWWIAGTSVEGLQVGLDSIPPGTFIIRATDAGLIKGVHVGPESAYIGDLKVGGERSLFLATTERRIINGRLSSDANATVRRFDGSGQFVWAQSSSGPDWEYATAMGLSQLGEIYLGGLLASANTPPSEPAFYQFGNIVIRQDTDWNNHYIAKLSDVAPPPIPALVSTIAGSGEQGHLDSQSPLTAKISSPDGGGVTRDGIIYFGDAGNHVIRYLLPNGEIGTFAGTPTTSGYREDFGLNALFNVPLGLHVTADGDLLVGDYANHRVRKISGRGYARTTLLAGGGNDSGLQTTPGPNVRLNGPNDLVQTPTGEIYFTEFLNHTVRKIDLDGKVTLIAGSPGQAGYANATGIDARFNGPAGITFHNNLLFVTDWNNHRIRKVTLNGEVTTLAGNGAPGLQNGYGTDAQCNAPNGIVADPAGNLYITEFSNHTIRRIAPDGWVSTLAGNGTPGYADGDRDTARFNAPGGISIHPDTSLIIADTGIHRIRRLVLNNTTTPINPTETLVTAELNPTLKIHGAIGERYRIESTDTLNPNNWQPLETITLTASPQTWTDPRPPLQSRLYRSIRE